MSHSSPYRLAYLWLIICTLLAVGSQLFSPWGITEPPSDDSSTDCRPAEEPRCPSVGTRKKPTQPEFDEIVARHERWLKLGTDAQDENMALWANLKDYDLRGLRITNVKLSYADLTNALLGPTPDQQAHATDLTNTDLEGATMTCSDLRRAELKDTGLRRADLAWAKLCGTDFKQSHLENADLLGANLADASLDDAKLEGAFMPYTNLRRTYFEIDPGSLPTALGLPLAKHLPTISFGYLPTPLVKLRDQFKQMGLRDQEKQLTVAIMRAEMRKHTQEVPIKFVHGNTERAFNKIFFDWTCEYGYKPGRCLKLLVTLFFLFALLYVVAQQFPGERGGIWAVWDDHRILRADGSTAPERLTNGFPPSALSETRLGMVFRRLGLSVVGLALWFSLLSAFQIGWQAFNFGIWFARMQPREYQLRATGWVRVAAGTQSLISVYFVALWLLTYFGTPFE